MNNTIFFKSLCLGILLSFCTVSCKTTGIFEPLIDPVAEENRKFLEPEQETEELFRVLIRSDRYNFSQMKASDKIKRTEDSDGDTKTYKELDQYNKIDEVCEATLSVWLFPESGKLMKIRPKTLASIAELNPFIVEDIKRWTFEFPEGTVEPKNFDIKYRIILQKTQSDADIIKEVMEKAKEEAEKKERKEKKNQ